MTNPIDSGSRPRGSGVNTDLHGKSTNKTSAGQATEHTAVETNQSSATQTGSTASSTVSERLQAVQDRIDSTPDVNAQRVADIKKSIAEGRYPINAQRIASKFVELQKLLNG